MPISIPPIQVATADSTVIAPVSARMPLTVTFRVGVMSHAAFVIPNP